MRFVGNHFIEISTGMEEDGKKRRENCKSRAISRRFFSSRTDHAKGRKGEERRTEAGEERKFNFHMEIWFCRGTHKWCCRKRKKRGQLQSIVQRIAVNFTSTLLRLYNSLLGVRTSILYTNVVAMSVSRTEANIFP